VWPYSALCYGTSKKDRADAEGIRVVRLGEIVAARPGINAGQLAVTIGARVRQAPKYECLHLVLTSGRVLNFQAPDLVTRNEVVHAI